MQLAAAPICTNYSTKYLLCKVPFFSPLLLFSPQQPTELHQHFAQTTSGLSHVTGKLPELFICIGSRRTNPALDHESRHMTLDPSTHPLTDQRWAASPTTDVPIHNMLPLPGSPASSWAMYRARLAAIFSGADPRVCLAFWLFGKSQPQLSKGWNPSLTFVR